MKFLANLSALATSAMLVPAVAVADTLPTRLTDWRTRDVSVQQPFMNDTVNNGGKSFKIAQTLNYRLSKQLKGATPVTADTAGFIALKAAPTGADSNSGILSELHTRIRAARFARGKIRVTSPVAYAVLLDGKELLTKETVEDSIGDASTRTADVRLEPEADATLTVRVLSTPADSIAPTVKIEYVPDDKFADVPLVSGPDMLRRLTLRDTEYTAGVSMVSLSPDGRYLLMRSTNRFDGEHTRYRATVSDLNSGRIVSANVPWYSQWMPDSNTLYYTEKTPDGYDLFMLDPVTGKEQLVATGLPVNSFTWSNDGTFFIYSKTDKAEKQAGPLRRYVTPDDRIPDNRNRSYLVKYTLATGLSQQLTFGNHSTYVNDIAPDDSRILVYTSAESPTVRPFYSCCVYELDLKTLRADTLVAPGPQLVNGAMYSPDGRQVLFTGSPEAFGGIGRNTGSLPMGNDFDTQLFMMELADRHVKPLTKDFDPSVSNVVWNKADGKIYLTAEQGFDVPVFVLDPRTDKFTKLPVDIDCVYRFSLPGHAANRMAYSGQGFTYGGAAIVMDLKTRRNTLVSDPDADHLAEIKMGDMEPWNFTAKDGTVIEGWVCYPPDYDADKKYPLIVYYYGGTSPTQKRLLQPYTPQLFASRDYIVYVLNPSGTTGYGQQFSARHLNAWGDYTASEIIEGVQKFCQAHPAVNPDKIGCIGASYGGFMTQYLQTLTPMFAAAVSHAGISNVTSYWGEGYWGYSYNGVAAAGRYPWTDPDLFTKHGSLFNADRINTPLLLLHGTADTNVPVGESIQLFNALKVLGKTVEFITVDGENHFISDFPKRQQWQNTIMAWFAKYLQDAPQWWDDLYPDPTL